MAEKVHEYSRDFEGYRRMRRNGISVKVRPLSDDGLRWPYQFMKRRAQVVRDLLKTDAESIDAVALTMIGLSALASFRYTFKASHENFRALLRNNCPSFVDRYAIPEMLRLGARYNIGQDALNHVRQQYPIECLGIVRESVNDPTVCDFEFWLDKAQIQIPPRALQQLDYSGRIHQYYRHSIIHGLRIAGGREAQPMFDDDGAIYYANVIQIGGPNETYLGAEHEFNKPELEMRFGVRHVFLADLYEEAIENLEAWALETRTHIFPEEHLES